MSHVDIKHGGYVPGYTVQPHSLPVVMSESRHLLVSLLCMPSAQTRERIWAVAPISPGHI